MYLPMKKAPSPAFSLEAKLNYASNAFIPIPILELLAYDQEWMVRKKVASHPSLTPGIASVLVADPYPEVRMELALNNSIPLFAARALARDSEVLVRMSLAQNSRLSPDILEELAADKNPSVREVLASRNPIPRDLAERLKGDSSLAVRLRLLRNPSLPPDIFLHVINDMHESQALEILEMAKPLPYMAQKALAQEGKGLIPAFLAASPWIDRDIWEYLCGHPDPAVRRMALNNPAFAHGEGGEGKVQTPGKVSDSKPQT